MLGRREAGIRRFAIALVALAGSVPVPAAQAAFPGANGRIAFERGADIYTVNPDGSALTNLTGFDYAATDGTPAWNADASKIAFISRRNGGNYQIYKMNNDGSDVVQVTHFASDYCVQDPAWSPDGQKIAFQSRCATNNSDDIMTINADGTDLTNLTANFPAATYSDERTPAWSPDGTKIALESGGNIWVMNADGTSPVKLTTLSGSGAAAREPNWSPDGQKIAFADSRDSGGAPAFNIYEMNADGTGRHRLTISPSSDASPAWSPDGSKIVFSRCTQSTGDCLTDLYVMNADGTGITPLSPAPGYDNSPDWGVPGVPPPPPTDLPGKIAFASLRNANYEIYKMNPDGTNQQRLTSNGFHDECPAWSPDGSKIAFNSDRSVGPAVYAMNADGTGQTRLSSGGPDGCPTWSPDGSKIAFESVRGNRTNLWVMNSNGTGETQITTGPLGTYDVSPKWSPDGETIAFLSNRAQNADYDVYTVKTDGSGLTDLTNSPTIEYFGLAWSPDGTKLAFVREGQPDPNGATHSQVWTMNADGSNQNQLTNESEIGASYPTWSPDGSKIAYATYIQDGGDAEVFSINLDGTGRTNLTNTPGGDFQPDWQLILKPGGYPRPRGATPIAVSLVPAFAACTTPNSAHGAPLAFGSCKPPAQTSSYLTVGTPDANGAQANSVGSERIDVVPGNPATTADEADLKIYASVTDVRLQSTLADYTGELRFTQAIRITDRDPGGTIATTSVDFDFGATVPCVREAPSGVGATCTLATTADTRVPGAIKEGKRALWQLDQVRVYDGGPDGDAETPAGNTLFLTQGVFVP